MLHFTRTLSFEARGEIKTGDLLVGNVHWSHARQKWCCEWSIAHLHPEVGVIGGSDPLDAFIKTIDFLSILIRGYEMDGLEIWWMQRGDHGGLVFPLSEDRKWEKVPPGFTGPLPPGFQEK